MRIVLTILLGMALCTNAQQDVHFSQFEKSPLRLSPGLAGLGKGYNRANLNYRSQWGNLGNTWRTMAFSWDMPLLFQKKGGGEGNTYMGLGLSFYNDKMGASDFTTNNFDFTLSVINYVSDKSRLSLGIQAGYLQHSISTDNVSWDSQWDGQAYDPSLPSNELLKRGSAGSLDLSAGLGWKFYDRNLQIQGFEKMTAYGGLAAYHLTRPTIDFMGSGYRMERRYTAFFNAEFGLTSSFVTLHPAFQFHRQGDLNNLVYGGLVKLMFRSDTKYTGFVNENAFGIGFYMRANDAIIPTFTYEIANFELGFSYDFNISSLRDGTDGYGGPEISLRWLDTDGRLFDQGNKHVVFMD